MPLPKAPAKKRLLCCEAADFEAQAAPQRRQALAEDTADIEIPAQAALELHDGGTALAARAPVTAPPAAQPARRAARDAARGTGHAGPRKPRGTGPAKLFVLDTNVLMHDPM